jgi:hypothetical protein
MAIKLNADETWTVCRALGDALSARRSGLASQRGHRLSEEELEALQLRYLRSATVLYRIQGECDEEDEGEYE